LDGLWALEWTWHAAETNLRVTGIKMYRLGYFNRLSISAFPVPTLHSVLHLTYRVFPRYQTHPASGIHHAVAAVPYQNAVAGSPVKWGSVL